MAKRWLFGALVVMTTSGSVAKTNSTYYTPERVAVGRENLARYAWAQALFDRLMNGDEIRYYIGPEYGPAQRYIDRDDEFMWMLQPTTSIPRAMEHDARAICPRHGTKVRHIDPWCPYRIDPFEHPYKIQCMLGGEWYPTNNYSAGDMSSGDFPDDGEGCRVGDRTYYFLREYAHMAYGSVVIPALRSLSQAYLLTGDIRYARRGVVLLARLASEYPNHEDRRDRLHYARYGGRDPHYRWKTGGMITDRIWETFCLEAAVYAYDGFFNYMDSDQELLAFLRGKGLPVSNGNDLRRYIEHYLLRAGMTGLLNGAIRGNEGFHQAAALACALVLDDYEGNHPNSADMVDYAFHGAGHAFGEMTNGLTRDGGGHESPSYNSIKLDFLRVNELMEEIRVRHPRRFPIDRYPDLFAEDKARRLFSWFMDVTVLDHFVLPIGDTGGIGPAHRNSPSQYSLLTHQNLYAFRRYGDPQLARAATKPDGSVFPGRLFYPYPAEALEAALAMPESWPDRDSRLLDGYGVAILASGTGSQRRALTVNYTSLIGHRQCDHLSLGLYARGIDLLPDLGYPTSWDYVWQWDGNSMAHNTVTVDETQPRRGFGGMARLFVSTQGLHVVATSHHPYPQARMDPPAPGVQPTRRYERLSLLVDVDEERFYVVDIFAVNGGEQHDQSWHGLLEGVRHPQLAWQAQATGTLAGPNVSQFDVWTDSWGRQRDDFPAFLTDIRRAQLKEPAVWTWSTGQPEGDALGLHLIPVAGPLEVIGGRGRSPARPPDWGLDYVLARRKPVDGATSVFVSVLDPYQGKPTVSRVRLVNQDPLSIEIERHGDVDRLQVNLPDTPSVTMDHRPMGVRLQTRNDNEGIREFRVGKWSAASVGYLHGVVAAVDYRRRRLAVRYDDVWRAELQPGCGLRVYNELRSALYQIEGIEFGQELIWIELDTGALLARGPVISSGDGRLQLAAFLTFAVHRPVDESGDLTPGPDYYAGSWAEADGKRAQVAGVVQWAGEMERNEIYLRGSGDAALVPRNWEGQVVSLWQYGVGDQVEMARLETATQSP